MNRKVASSLAAVFALTFVLAYLSTAVGPAGKAVLTILAIPLMILGPAWILVNRANTAAGPPVVCPNCGEPLGEATTGTCPMCGKVLVG